MNTINTLCNGFTLVAYKNITKKQFVQMLNNLQKKFNDHYDTDEYNFSPELISEGGIVFDNFNDKNKYKTMRLYFIDNKSKCQTESLYGTISTNTKEKWKTIENILIKKDQYLGTFLKSFRDAPGWTADELKIFIDCFDKMGLMIDTIPTTKELKKLKNQEYYLNLFNI